MCRFVLVSVLACIAAPSTHAQKEAAFPELGLTFTLPELENFKEQRQPESEQTRAVWTGKLPSCEVRIHLICLPTDQWGFTEAGGVSDQFISFSRRTRDFDVTTLKFLEGDYGYAPVLAVATGRAPITDGGPMVEYIATGYTQDFGYGLHIECRSPPSTEDASIFDAFFEKGISYEGPDRVPEWTMEEIRKRWEKDTPDDLHKDFARNLSKKAWFKKAVIRTENYLILTNASGGKNFAKQMEKNYKEIVKTFPFANVKGRRLMPVFLFRDSEQYFQFCVKMGDSYEKAKRSAGHAWKDYYATWYKSPKDPVHIHEQTHQIFSQRLYLNGGGSWYQEGVAEYVSSRDNDRNIVASQVKKGRHDPLHDFFQRKSLLYTSQANRTKGGSEASDLYTQAALFIEFLRESKFGKDNFERFLEKMGHVPRWNLEKIEDVFSEAYDVTLEQLDKEFRAYCKKR